MRLLLLLPLLLLVGCDTTLNKNEVINLSCVVTGRTVLNIHNEQVKKTNVNWTFSMSINKSKNTISTTSMFMGDYKNLRESELEYFASKENDDYLKIDRTTLRFMAAHHPAKKIPTLKADSIFWEGSCRKSDKI